MTFRHFILTRYVLKFDGRPLPDGAWHKHRRELFERYCLPYVAAQTAPDFVWLLLYDQSLDWMADEIARWQRTCPQLVGVPADCAWEDCKHVARAAMRAHLTPDITHVISTRLDNDDTIAPGFLAAVQAEFRGQTEREFINFFAGENLFTASGHRRPHPHAHNMFASLIEPVNQFAGILSWAHNSIGYEGRLTNLPTRGMWVHNVHGRNEWGADRLA